MEEIFIHMQNPEGLALWVVLLSLIGQDSYLLCDTKNGLHNVFSVHEKKKRKKISYHSSYFGIDLDATASQWNNTCSYARKLKNQNPLAWLA